MKLEDALQKANELGEIEEILDSGGYFCSAFVMLDRDEDIEMWNLGFYSEEDDEITAVEVTDEGAELGVTDKPIRKHTNEIKIGKVTTDAEEVLEKTKDFVDEEYGNPYKKILMSLKKKDEDFVWEIAFIGGGADIISVTVDAGDGEILDSEKTSLIRKGGGFAG